MSPHRPLRLVAATGAASLLVLAACDASVEVTPPSSSPTEALVTSTAPSPSPSPSPTVTSTPPSPTPTPSPSVSQTPTTTTPSATTPAPRPVGLRGRLLTAAEVPGFNEEYTWRTVATRDDEGKRPFGTCQKFPMTSIGATRVVAREYAGVGDDPTSSAGHLVAEFADRATARRAYEVARSWRDSCEEELREYDRVDVNPFEPVSTTDAEGGWYLLVYGPVEGGSPDEGYFDAQGLALSGKRVALLQMRMLGQDYNYPAGREPMVAAVRTAAARLR